MNVRTFKLIDASGNSYDLQTQNRFLHTPEGLGYEESTTYQDFGSRYAALDEGLAQSVVKGVITFTGGSREEIYNKFFEFAKFTRNAPLTLEYTPIFDTFLRKCRVSRVVKTEISAGVLQVNVEIACMTQWYQIKSDYNSGIVGDGKMYALQDSGINAYKYTYQYSNNIKQSVTIQNDSNEESPCRVIIYGYAVNPIWNHYVNGELFASGAADMTVAANHKLVIDTTTIPYTMRELDMFNNLVRDAYQLSDFSTERFIRLQPGQNRITLTHTGSNTIAVGVEAQIEYATV